jgi:hypothetical protein
MIAATALVHGLTLVTGNVNHYERVRTFGHPLRIETWRDGRVARLGRAFTSARAGAPPVPQPASCRCATF